MENNLSERCSLLVRKKTNIAQEYLKSLTLSLTQNKTKTQASLKHQKVRVGKVMLRV